jgi:sigma-B regulation protein RsbU (phosphoserine phosphatase)
MATLRAYLRGQTIRGESDLAALMATLNELVYESSASNRYATFFYGQYETLTRQLHYVNAGHNPPMIFRQGSAGIIRLDTGGPVIGLFEGSRYTEGRVTLERGDLLVAFTDGVSEAIDAADIEWGESGLIEAVRSSGTSDVRELIARIMTAADAFVAGAAQYDDMTLVVVRVT